MEELGTARRNTAQLVFYFICVRNPFDVAEIMHVCFANDLFILDYASKNSRMVTIS